MIFLMAAFFYKKPYLRSVIPRMKHIFFILLIFISLEGKSQLKRMVFDENVRRTVIYPNPARSFLQVQYKQPTSIPEVLVVYNFLGKKQLEVSKPGNNLYIDLAEFKRGLYIFQFRDNNGRILDSGKFQVEK
ncbi:MAG: T9SS type A sorting domain-containing protein [bacterium]|jgi:hypothetical protein